MAKAILYEQRGYTDQEGDLATLRVYVTAAAKRAVVVKEEDLLTKLDMASRATEVAVATATELKTWIRNK